MCRRVRLVSHSIAYSNEAELCLLSGYFLGACSVNSGPSTGNTILDASCSNGDGGTVESSIDVGECSVSHPESETTYAHN